MTVDEGRAVAWLSLAAEQKFPPAVKAREDMLPRLSAKTRDRANKIIKEIGLRSE
jgi:hypothetical protein